MIKKFVYTLFLLVIATASFGANYFVAQSGAGSGDGSSYANRMSVANYNSGNLNASTSPGDTIYLCGTITTPMNTTEGGSGGTYLYFNGDCSTQGGTDVDFEVGSSSTAITVDVDYTDWYWIQTSGVTGQGMLTTYTAGVNYLTIRNSYFTSSTAGAGGVFLDGASNVTIGGSATASCLFKDIGSTDSAAEDIALRGQAATPTNDVLISYNEMRGNGTSAGSDGVMCNDDEQDDVGDPGHEVIIEHNYIHDHWKENELDFKGGGYFIVRKNIIDGPPDNYDSTPAIVIQHAGTDHVWMYGNVIRNFSTDGPVAYDSNATSQPVQYIYWWSNLIYNIDWSGMVFSPGSNQGTDYVRVWNNTVVDNAANPSNTGQSGLRSAGSWDKTNDFLFYNNIVAFNRHGATSVPTRQVYGISGSAGSFVFDYNQYYSADGSITIHDGTADRSFSYWQSTSGQDANGTEANPGFTARASDDYTTTTNLGGAESGSTLRGWHADADKGLDEDSDINPQQCGNTPGGYAYCAKGLALVDRDSFNSGVWGKGAYVYGSSAEEQPKSIEGLNLY